MDYNQIVKIVTTTRFANGSKDCTVIQKLNWVGNIIVEQELMHNYWEKITTYKYNEDGKVIFSTAIDNDEYIKSNTYTVFEYMEDGSSIGKRYSKDDSLLAVEYYNCSNQKVKAEGYLGKFLFCTRFWKYDESGNQAEELMRYEDTGQPMSKGHPVGIIIKNCENKYDSSGNQISHITYSEDGKIESESYSTYNEKNQKIYSIRKSSFGGKFSEKTVSYEYEITVEDVKEDSQRAEHHFEINNGKNSDEALYYTGFAYFSGEGLPQSMEKARDCFEKIENRPYDVDNILGCMYFEGVGGPVRPEAGEKCLRHVMESNDRKISGQAANDLGGYLRRQMNRPSEVIELFEYAIEQGNSDALVNLGKAYYDGYGVPKDLEKARNYFEKIENRPCDVDNVLGSMYLEGVGGPVRPEAGEKCLRHAMESDDKEVSGQAANDLGYYLYEQTIRISESIELFRYAEEQGETNALVNLGRAYCEGKGVPQDFEKAKSYFQLAAKQGNTTAQENLKVLQARNNTTDSSGTQKGFGCLFWTVGVVLFVACLYVLRFLGVFG